jgi:hypothetical protein
MEKWEDSRIAYFHHDVVEANTASQPWIPNRRRHSVAFTTVIILIKDNSWMGRIMPNSHTIQCRVLDHQ